jgi:hypothetical protein
MSSPDEIVARLGDDWIPRIYSDRVRTQRTRIFDMAVPEKENRPEVLYTLMGIDLKVGRRRYHCPDLASARYLTTFARLGCRRVAIPYDITRISTIADDLDVSWHRMLLLIGSDAGSQRLRRDLVRRARIEINSIGAGDPVPEFTQSTKQREA